jgi:hypothetical protein
MDVVWVLLFVAVLVAMYWLGYRLDPHFVSKNGYRFLCLGQEVEADWQLVGRPRETWVYLLADGSLQLRQKRFLRRRTGIYRLIGKAPDPPKKKTVYLVRSDDDPSVAHYVALRLPSTSKIIPELDSMLPPGV